MLPFQVATVLSLLFEIKFIIQKKDRSIIRLNDDNSHVFLIKISCYALKFTDASLFFSSYNRLPRVSAKLGLENLVLTSVDTKCHDPTPH